MTDMFYHWSDKPVQLGACSYGQEIGYKPSGLWFDVNGAWREWCESEEFHLDCLSHCHEIRFTDEANILRMSTAAELMRFTGEFAAPLYAGQGLDMRHCGINWPGVAKIYDGILITPYIWSCRLELMWYYGFDCASGCVWNTGIAELHPTEVSA